MPLVLAGGGVLPSASVNCTVADHGYWPVLVTACGTCTAISTAWPGLTSLKVKSAGVCTWLFQLQVTTADETGLLWLSVSTLSWIIGRTPTVPELYTRAGSPPTEVPGL